MLRKQRPRDGPLSGQTLVFTGTLNALTRTEARSIVERLGGRTSEDVGRNIDYVVAGRDPGSKCGLARERGIPVLRERQFLRLIQAPKRVRRGRAPRHATA